MRNVRRMVYICVSYESNIHICVTTDLYRDCVTGKVNKEDLELRLTSEFSFEPRIFTVSMSGQPTSRLPPAEKRHGPGQLVEKSFVSPASVQ